MSWVAAAVGGAAVVGSVISSDAARSAANKQSDAAQSASDATLQQFNTINDQQAPYRQAGYGALNKLTGGSGIAVNAPTQNRDNFDEQAYLAANPDVAKNWDMSNKTAYDHYLMYGQKEGRAFTGNAAYNQQLEQSKQSQANAANPGENQFTHEFNANDLTANLAPNYDFMLKQGQGQTSNFLNSTGGLVSGNAAQGLNTFSQNFAKNAYQDAFNNYTTNQNNIYSRLANLAGIGQNSLQQSSAAGMNATNASNNFLTSGAAAQAAGTVGQANAISSGINGVSNGVLLNSLINKKAA